MSPHQQQLTSETTSERMWLQNDHSDGILATATPTPSTLLSPEGGKLFMEQVSSQIKGFLETLPSREKNSMALADTMLDQTPIASNKTVVSPIRKAGLQKSSSDRSLGSNDLLPTIPSRMLTPLDGEKVVVADDGQLKDLLDNLSSPEKKTKALPNTLIDETSIASNKAVTFSRRRGFQKRPSDRSLGSGSAGSVDSTPTLPSRLQSPLDGGKVVVEATGPLEDLFEKLSSERENEAPRPSDRSIRSGSSVDSIPMIPARCLSPEGEKGFMEVTDQLKDLLGGLRSRHKEKEPHIETTRSWTRTNRLKKSSSEQNLGTRRGGLEKASSERNLGTRRGRLKKASSERSLSCVDSTPLLPSRFLSPEGKKVPIQGSSQRKESLPCPDERKSPLSAAMKIVQTPLKATKLSTRAVDSEIDIREFILGRIPDHVKDLLSMEQWYRILDPIKGTGTRTTNSDIPDDANAFHESEKMEVSKAAGSALQQTMEQETKLEIVERDEPSWMKAHEITHDTLDSTEEERKHQEVGEDQDDCSLFTSSGEFVKSKAHDLNFNTAEDTAEEDRNARKKKKNSVSFGNAQIRWHERILEVHPCTSSGPSVGIGWECIHESEERIQWNRRRGVRLRLDREEREEIIKEQGYSTKDIACSVREILKIKKQRRRTYHNVVSNPVKVEKIEYIAEKCNRKIRKLHRKFSVHVKK
ncbi:unnamed protein product [Cylindrotheca closterium]|uniref:Uncharacterized protein n=1 Tax=Cylindrotheca closterium TaxID=2856 RepID=A0AAD2CJV5_9STRA|nr:unnamed protein product [Cylindrotheca closterium]